MAEMLLVNPRRKSRRVHHKRRTPRRMSALQRQYFGKGPRRRRRRTKVEVLAGNPSRKRRRSVTRRRRRSGLRHRVRARAMRLRGFNARSFLNDTLLPSGVGAIGALGVDVVLGYATPYLPSFMTTGVGVPLTKIAGAVGLGAVAGMVTNRRIGEQVMAGAITVVLYNYLRTQVQASLPNLTLAGVGNYMGYAGPALAYPDRMGMYVGSGGAPALPAPVLQAIAANAAKPAAAQTVGEYVGDYERAYLY